MYPPPTFRSSSPKVRMNKLFDAAQELHQFFVQNKYSYVIIGGIAVQFWGEPRLTQNIDITVLSLPDKEKELINLLIKNFSPRIPNPLDFALKNRIILLTMNNGIPADIALGIYGYEEEVIKRSIAIKLESGKEVIVCSPEDLIIHKASAGRPRDVQDIEGIVFRQQNKLNVKLIRKWLEEFSTLLPIVPVKDNFEKSWKKLQEMKR